MPADRKRKALIPPFAVSLDADGQDRSQITVEVLIPPSAHSRKVVVRVAVPSGAADETSIVVYEIDERGLRLLS